MSVVAYHLDPHWAPGGYVGVDVFFVISGFLITRHLLREVAERGRISLPEFWANRVRRILPASLVVIVVTMAAAWLWYPIDTVERLSSEGLSATWYFQNWALAAQAVDYSAADNAASAVQHFWSLSVEEQFYLVWPMLLLGVAALASRTDRSADARPARTRRWLTIAMTVVAAASFGYSVAVVASGTAGAYFDTFGRLWELALGGVLAGLYRDPHAHPRLRAVVSVAGFALVGLACFWFTPDTAFPGVAALLPTVGAALVIAAGHGDTRLSLTPILEWRPIQAIGDWSYSIYLWHFGLIITATTLVQPAQLRLPEKLGLLAATVILSALSYRFIEQPFRTERWRSRRPRFVLAVAAAALLVTSAACLSLPLKVTSTRADWEQRAQSVQSEVDAYRVDPQQTAPTAPFPDGRVAMTPSPLDVTTGWQVDPLLTPEPAGSVHPCQAGVLDLSTPACAGGATTSPIRVALVGDSHATMFVPPLVEIATQRGWRLETHLHASCPFTLTTRHVETINHVHCQEANRATLEELLRDPPALVISVAMAEAEWVGADQNPAVGVDGHAQIWTQLRKAGSQVVVVRDTPEPRPNVIHCLTVNYADPLRCSRSTALSLKDHDEVVTAAAQVPGVSIIDLEPVMCAEKSCPPVINHILVYRDRGHLTRAWALALTSYLDERLPKLPSR